ncbi:MAG TPA: hypothetical protein VF092_19740 [Longimicrobium sp.]
MDATMPTRPSLLGASELDHEAGPPALIRELGAVLHLQHEDGPRGGSWAVRDEVGKQVYSLGHRPNGGTRVGVRDASGAELASLGERVLSLVEHFTIWHGNRPCARVYRPGGGAHRGRWFVEVGGQQGWVVLTDASGFRVFSGGAEVARSLRRELSGMPSRVDLAPGVDVPLVLLLAELLSVAGEFP